MSTVQTHFLRIRKDFRADQVQCHKLRKNHAQDEKGRRSDAPCQLPNECEYCSRWVCNACEEVVPWSNGNGATPEEGGGLLCDGCWVNFLESWEEEEEALERFRMAMYESACAL